MNPRREPKVGAAGSFSDLLDALNGGAIGTPALRVSAHLIA